jgi:hypothetical protein
MRREVDAIVEERTFREFAGSSQASTELGAGAEHGVEDRGSTMTLQLDDVLPRERSRCAEADGDAVVQHPLRAVSKECVMSMPRTELQPGDRFTDAMGVGPGQSHDADAAATRRRGDGSDGVGDGVRHDGAAVRSPWRRRSRSAG